MNCYCILTELCLTSIIHYLLHHRLILQTKNIHVANEIRNGSIKSLFSANLATHSLSLSPSLAPAATIHTQAARHREVRQWQGTRQQGGGGDRVSLSLSLSPISLAPTTAVGTQEARGMKHHATRRGGGGERVGGNCYCEAKLAESKDLIRLLRILLAT